MEKTPKQWAEWAIGHRPEHGLLVLDREAKVIALESIFIQAINAAKCADCPNLARNSTITDKD